MQAFFSGTVVLLYLISRAVAEPVFIAACLLPALYGVAVGCCLRFGACGKIIVAKNRAARMARKGVISGEKRDLFYKKCVKSAPIAVRAAFALFLEDKIDSSELALTASRSVKVRGSLLKGGTIGVGVFCILLVFSVFYFTVPLGEALLRAAVCGCFAAADGVGLHFALYAYVISAEKAAERFAGILEQSLLRVKKAEPQEPPTILPSEPAEEDPDEKTLFDLRALLRELEEGRQNDQAV